MGVHP